MSSYPTYNLAHSLIYLDYAATTPVDPRIIPKMINCLSLDGDFGNSQSTHPYGESAKLLIHQARSNLASLIGADSQNIIFTSGATESNNLALKGVASFYQSLGKHIITSEIEHRSVLDTCKWLENQGFKITYIKPKANGLIAPEDIQKHITQDTILVSIHHVNNEIGIIQNIKAIGAITRASKIFFHVDAAQSLGKLPICVDSLEVDLMSFAGHKIYGPKGIGALYLANRPKVRLAPLMHGGGQERGFRAGTLPTHQIVGMGEAAAIYLSEGQNEQTRLAELKARLWAGICDLPIKINGADLKIAGRDPDIAVLDSDIAVPGILNITFDRLEGYDADHLTNALKNLAVSKGAACNAATHEPSHVLKALGVSEKDTERTIRISIGRMTTPTEVDDTITIIRDIYR